MKYLHRWLFVLAVAWPAPSAAQGLADVARAEDARRKAAPKAAKVYTNDDLRPDQRASSSVSAAPVGNATAVTPPAGTPGTPGTAPAPEAEPKRDEPYWRGRIAAARDQLQRHRLFADALQSRITALSTDFVNRDDPAQRALVAEDRQTARAGLARVENEIRAITRSIADIEEEARRAGVPPGWLR